MVSIKENLSPCPLPLLREGGNIREVAWPLSLRTLLEERLISFILQTVNRDSSQ
jgi:hypothetical protein